MAVDWDSVAGCRALDPADMLGRLLEFPAQLRPAYDAGRRLALPAGYKHIRQVVVAGMGGSAIAGDYAAALLRDRCRVPVLVWRDYGLPAFAGPDTLVVASSYSGNTEETLAPSTGPGELAPGLWPSPRAGSWAGGQRPPATRSLRSTTRPRPGPPWLTAFFPSSAS